MIQHHKWSLTEIEDMLPYERTLYSELLVQWVNEENARMYRFKEHFSVIFSRGLNTSSKA